MTRYPTALTAAGSDSGGGAGIQADLKTFAAHGVFGMSAITAITAQNTRGVTRVDLVPVEGFRAQLDAVFSDLRVDVLKIGMLATAAHASALADVLASLPSPPPVVLDPVMVASTGHRLLTEDAIAVIRDRLLPRCVLATPNLAEAAVLAGGAPLEDWLAACPSSILVTGGDPPEGAPPGGEIHDVWWEAGRARRVWTGPRIGTRPFHGTGCTLASAIAANLALGHPLEDAIDRAIGFVRALIGASAASVSPGHGNPVLPHHAHARA